MGLIFQKKMRQKKIGIIRERNRKNFPANDKAIKILICSLLYAMDKGENTVWTL